MKWLSIYTGFHNKLYHKSNRELQRNTCLCVYIVYKRVYIYVLDIGKYNGKLVEHINDYTENPHMTFIFYSQTQTIITQQEQAALVTSKARSDSLLPRLSIARFRHLRNYSIRMPANYKFHKGNINASIHSLSLT